MQRRSTRRLLTTGVLVLALSATAVACGGDDSSSDLSRDELLAILAAAQVDQNLVSDLTDDQLGDVVDQLLQGLDQAQQPTATDSTVAGTEPATVDSQPATDPTDSQPSSDDAQTTEGDEEQTDTPTPSSIVIITLPNNVSIPIASLPLDALTNLRSTLAVTDVTFADAGGLRTYSITVTEDGLGGNDITSVKVKWVVDGFETPLTAQKSSDTSTTKSVWTVKVESGPATLIVTARDENGKEVSRSLVLTK